jgi:esterase/lipase superfamily enzyme
MARARLKIVGWSGLALLVLGGIFYYTVYWSTGAALNRAEGFLFRRMTVSELGERGAHRFFFVTNRVRDVGADPLEESFTGQREPELKFGVFDTHIEPTLGLGMLIDPSQWFQNEEIRLDRVDLLEQEEFVEQLRALVDQSPRRSLLININGFRERFPSALRKTAFLGHVLDVNAPILTFDWPGDQGGSLSGYQRARGIAEASGADLAATIRLVVNKIQPDHLWIMANSMGGEVIVNAFDILHEDPDFADTETEIEDVILTAPDVDREDLNVRFKNNLTEMATSMTVYVSSNDRALVTSRLINRSARGGESTLNPGNPDQLEEAIGIAKLIDPDSDLITLVDVTPVNRTRNFHNFSLETPEFYDDVFLRLYNEKTPRSRRIYPVITPEGRTYWVITRGR